MVATTTDYAQAGELKIGQVGIANLRVRVLDIPKLIDEMRDRVQRAPKLFERAAVVVDFGSLSQCPDGKTARALLDGLRDAGVLPVALAFGTTEVEELSRSVGLPLLAKFRAQYERSDTSSAATHAPAAVPAAAVATNPPAAAIERAPPARAPTAPGLVHTTPVRSGQQVYAQGRDLTVCAAVGAGSEVMADGSVHIYGPLRGRAMAGALGDTDARIFCRAFHAELVAVAGNYKVLDEIPKELHGKPVQIFLRNDALVIEAMD
ncbi:MAG: septum site-determining protein MinC [Lysobacteraceae bacterium]